ELTGKINQAGEGSVPIVSLDVPSGLDATTGQDWGATVIADLTVTFGSFKIGQWVGRGLDACGRIWLTPAGFPEENVLSAAQNFVGYGLAEVATFLPERKKHSHKYTNGKVLIIAGSEGMWGAAILAATSALRAGVGHVTLAGFSPPLQIVQTLPEVLSLDLASSEVDFSKYDACLVGPGLKDDSGLEDLMNRLRSEKVSKVVLDATALAVFARWKKDEQLLRGTENWILTPHEGEAKKLLRGGVAEKAKVDRWQLYEGLSQTFPSTFILKGPKSWIFSGKQKPVSISLTGNDALAKAGTGDVLAGVVVGFFSQMESSHDAAVLGCVTHGAAADLWAYSHSRRSLLVSDLPGLVGDVLSTFEGV
ncbi:MAG: NAD(P)H-hydrate dehydratase, partial [Bdellovibrionales bacterium]|nr:NAD(P)H-hydrate dehydratase [Bdellovibrionales bacterium]